MTVLSLIFKGGWVMIFILICSIVGVWIYVERILAYNRLRLNGAILMDEIRKLLSQDKDEEALARTGSFEAPVAKVLSAGLAARHKGRETIKDAVEAEGNRQLHSLEERTSILATVAGIAPLLGFFGTVLGMIKAFQQIENLGGNVNATVLAGGIWEAMVTTAAGLAVGIPAVVAYNHLTQRISTMAKEMEDAGAELVVLLS